MNIADVVSTRATCVKRQVSSVITKEEQIIATGYNGAPRGLRHSAEVGCLRQQLDIPSGTHHELCRGLHAEQMPSFRQPEMALIQKAQPSTAPICPALFALR